MLVLKLVIEGLILGALLILVCALGKRGGAVKMAFLYSPDVQERCIELGLTTAQRLKRGSRLFRWGFSAGFVVYSLVCVYAINGARGFVPGFWQIFVILSFMNVTDRLFIDGIWISRTKEWIIPGTEDMLPYLTASDKLKKWIIVTVGTAALAALMSEFMTQYVG